MRTAKQLKKYIKEQASKDPDKYYATGILRRDGFFRGKCSKCSVYFWSTDKNKKVCGDSMCTGGFRFYEDNPCKKKLDYIQVWREFSKLFKTLGYTPIKRYPTVSRWNPTMDFTIASIAAFQPFVISGEVEPPANPLVIPQFCLRFGDIDNVGYTGSHMTGFVMIGQHMFMPEDRWDQENVFEHIKKWLNTGLGIPDSEITFHEDAWAGGGNAGPCMEFFVRGLELGNQVYMLYEQTPDDELVDLKLKVLDMGMGQERIAWFTQGTNTMYEAVFPTVVDKLLKVTGVTYDQELMKRFRQHSGKLNLDEVDNIDLAWSTVAELVGESTDTLKEKIMPLAGIFSIAEHTRALLFVLNDGGLPSNVGGGYNLRVLIRRALAFIDKFKWDLRLADVCRMHAEYLLPIFPELIQKLDDIEKVLDVEREKYEATKVKTRQIVEKIIQKDISEKILLNLYDSYGISPELVREESLKLGKKVLIPDNFFAKISDMHEQKVQVHATKKDFTLDLDGVPETKANYYDDYTKNDFFARVLKVIDNKVILDKTLFYPTSGGQLHDTGKIDDQDVIDVFRQGGHIIHVMSTRPEFKHNEVHGIVDLDIRRQLAQHHTATHIINHAAKDVLGSHVNQAGAKKTKEKAHLDITHYQSISDKELMEIENRANEIVQKDIQIEKKIYPRREAEDLFGMEIYQGGAVPGKDVRIVNIKGIDVEACGGTHLNSTGETGLIRIEKASKIQDGIIRLTFTAGKAARSLIDTKTSVLNEIAELLDVMPSQVPGRTKEIFSLWKTVKKAKRKGRTVNTELKSTDQFDGDALSETAKILRTQPEHIIKSLKRFLGDIESAQKGSQ